MRELVVQIDAWLPDGAPTSSRSMSPSPTSPPHDVPVYWWSNIAVPETAGDRVLAPADAAFRFDYSRTLRRVADAGRRRRRPQLPGPVRPRGRLLLRPPASLPARGSRPSTADGYGLLQTSSPRLRGRKLFVWGTGRGGRHWQEWLSPRGGAYLEIQAGLARTQLEHLPLPAGERWSWLETYGPLQLDRRRRARALVAAVTAVTTELAGRRLVRRQVEIGLGLRGPARSPSGSSGPPGGARWRSADGRATGKCGPTCRGTPFAERRPGARAAAVARPPRGSSTRLGRHRRPPATRPPRAGGSLLEYAAGPYAALQRGVARWAGGDRLGAVDAWEQSLRDQPSAIGWRNVAVAYAAR